MRIQVNLSDELVKQLDEYAKAVGFSRSALCGYFIGQGMFGINKTFEVATQALRDAVRQQENGCKGQMSVKPDGSIVEDADELL